MVRASGSAKTLKGVAALGNRCVLKPQSNEESCLKSCDWVLGEWEATLTALEQDPKKLVGKCDWVTKQWLLEDFAESEGLDWDNLDHLAWLQSQDLEYHNSFRFSL